MKEIKDIEVVHHYLLDIAEAVNKVLSAHNIPLIMGYGTMLGSIRHKGFIPWDDDMDFYVPFEGYSEMVKILQEELPAPYEVVMYTTHNSCKAVFAKVHDKRTCLNTKSNYNQLENNLGINIDLFPIKLVDKSDPSIRRYFRCRKIHQVIYTRDIYGRWYIELVKTFLRSFWPISDRRYKEMFWSYASTFKPGDSMMSVFDDPKCKPIMPKSFFDSYTTYKFDRLSLSGPTDYDAYLKHLYGDYMRLPPEEKRHWHADGVYER